MVVMSCVALNADFVVEWIDGFLLCKGTGYVDDFCVMVVRRLTTRYVDLVGICWLCEG